METKKLVLKGDISPDKMFKKCIPASIILAAIGLPLAIFMLPKIEFGYAGTRWAFEYAYGPFAGGMAGVLAIGLAAVLPFLGAAIAKKMYIDVYEDRVCGVYMKIEGGISYIPYELTYDKIESVSAQKTKVYLQISGRTLESEAFNADDIVREIKARLPR